MGRRILTRSARCVRTAPVSSPPMSPTALPPIVLAFAATDPTGGAGLQADLLTLSSMGCYALSVVTAVTLQDTAGGESLHPGDSYWGGGQAPPLLEGMPLAPV